MRGRVANHVIESLEKKDTELVDPDWEGCRVYKYLDVEDIRNPDGD